MFQNEIAVKQNSLLELLYKARPYDVATDGRIHCK